MVVWRANFARCSGGERVEGRGKEAGGEEKRWGGKEVGGRSGVVRGGGLFEGWGTSRKACITNNRLSLSHSQTCFNDNNSYLGT